AGHAELILIRGAETGLREVDAAVRRVGAPNRLLDSCHALRFTRSRWREVARTRREEVCGRIGRRNGRCTRRRRRWFDLQRRELRLERSCVLRGSVELREVLTSRLHLLPVRAVDARARSEPLRSALRRS